MFCDSLSHLPIKAPTTVAAAHEYVSTIEGLSLGATVDMWLGGGLNAQGVHEFYAGQATDGVSALGFAALLAQLKCETQHKPLIWVREARCSAQMGLPYGPGLLDLGLNPDIISLLMLPDARAVLRAGLDSMRAGVAGAVLIELAGRQPLLDLTATRRFALAAAEMGTMMLLVRISANPTPSAAHSRWQVAAAPSQALEANAPGRTAFDLTLLRHRGRRDGLHLILEWNRDTGSFQQREEHTSTAPLSRTPSAVAGGGAGDTQRNRAA